MAPAPMLEPLSFGEGVACSKELRWGLCQGAYVRFLLSAELSTIDNTERSFIALDRHCRRRNESGTDCVCHIFQNNVVHF